MERAPSLPIVTTGEPEKSISTLPFPAIGASVELTITRVIVPLPDTDRLNVPRRFLNTRFGLVFDATIGFAIDKAGPCTEATSKLSVVPTIEPLPISYAAQYLSAASTLPIMVVELSPSFTVYLPPFIITSSPMLH